MTMMSVEFFRSRTDGGFFIVVGICERIGRDSQTAAIRRMDFEERMYMGYHLIPQAEAGGAF